MMNSLKRQIFIFVCIGFLVLYLASAWSLTNWETENVHNRMNDNFKNAYKILSLHSRDDNFVEHAESYLTELSVNLAEHDIYAAAVILDEYGKILVQSNVSNIYFNERGRTPNVNDLSRLTNCISDAQEGFNDKMFPKGEKSAGFSSSGPTGYTQGWTLDKNDGNMRYVFMNAKYFERELAVKKMIPRYILTFIIMAMTCLLLCLIISRLFSSKNMRTE